MNDIRRWSHREGNHLKFRIFSDERKAVLAKSKKKLRRHSRHRSG
jgi:hypothetical protein